MVSRACELNANRVVASAPANPTFQTVFNNLCNRTPGETYTMLDAGGLPLVLESGTVLAVQFRQGNPDVGDPAVGDPGIPGHGNCTHLDAEHR